MASTLPMNVESIKAHMQKFGSQLYKTKNGYTLVWDDAAGMPQKRPISKADAEAASKAGVAVAARVEDAMGTASREAQSNLRGVSARVQSHASKLAETHETLGKLAEKKTKLRALVSDPKASAAQVKAAAVSIVKVRDKIKSLQETARTSTKALYNSMGIAVSNKLIKRRAFGVSADWAAVAKDPEALNNLVSETLKTAQAGGAKISPKLAEAANATVTSRAANFMFGDRAAKDRAKLIANKETAKSVRSTQNVLLNAIEHHGQALKKGKQLGNARLRFAKSIEAYLGTVMTPEALKEIDVLTMVRGNIREWEKQLVPALTELKGSLKGSSLRRGASAATFKGDYRASLRSIMSDLVAANVKMHHFGDDAARFDAALSEAGKTVLGTSDIPKLSKRLAKVAPTAEKAAALAESTGFVRKIKAAATSAKGLGKLVGGGLGLPLALFGPSMVRDVVTQRGANAATRTLLTSEIAASTPEALYRQILDQEILAKRAARLQSAPGLMASLNPTAAAGVDFGGLRVSDGLPATAAPQQQITAEQVAALLEQG